MLKQLLGLMLVFSFSLKAKSQSDIISFIPIKEDSNNHYYLTFCEEYLELLYQYRWEHYMDSCKVDFVNFDLEGFRQGNSVKWRKITPKRYVELPFSYLREYNNSDWNVHSNSVAIEDSITYKELKKKLNDSLNETVDFNKQILIYNNIWLDCSGTFYPKTLYDIKNNTILYKIIEVYGGSAGMCSQDSWILIDKPNNETEIYLDKKY